jgi:hypothetical protein
MATAGKSKTSAAIIPLHRYAGYRSPIPNAHIARALGDPDDVLREAVKADNLRDGVPLEERQADNLRRFYSANPRLNGPARHERIGDDVVRFTLADAIITAAIAVLIGMIVAGAF